ncbi:hypothetical protein DRH29_00990 [candidate division Kazan bacterium]|uniref:Peptidase C39 domain-containing protein n=1 Tax=candidate division Kazan bacterium TaxID=2202143 RepID=A0A420ZDD5_UNCK3|nr:MAG: hypothetical protein DRH29_00990 [candidate division Kazan bacterium]
MEEENTQPEKINPYSTRGIEERFGRKRKKSDETSASDEKENPIEFEDGPIDETIGTETPNMDEAAAKKQREKFSVTERLSPEDITEIKNSFYKQNDSKSCVLAAIINGIESLKDLAGNPTRRTEERQTIEKLFAKWAGRRGIYNPKKGMSIAGAEKFLEQSPLEVMKPSDAQQLFEELQNDNSAIVFTVQPDSQKHAKTLRVYKNHLLFIDPAKNQDEAIEYLDFSEESVKTIFDQNTGKNGETSILVIGDVGTEFKSAANKGGEREKPIVKPGDWLTEKEEEINDIVTGLADGNGKPLKRNKKGEILRSEKTKRIDIDAEYEQARNELGYKELQEIEDELNELYNRQHRPQAEILKGQLKKDYNRGLKKAFNTDLKRAVVAYHRLKQAKIQKFGEPGKVKPRLSENEPDETIPGTKAVGKLEEEIETQRQFLSGLRRSAAAERNTITGEIAKKRDSVKRMQTVDTSPYIKFLRRKAAVHELTHLENVQQIAKSEQKMPSMKHMIIDNPEGWRRMLPRMGTEAWSGSDWGRDERNKQYKEYKPIEVSEKDQEKIKNTRQELHKLYEKESQYLENNKEETLIGPARDLKNALEEVLSWLPSSYSQEDWIKIAGKLLDWNPSKKGNKYIEKVLKDKSAPWTSTLSDEETIGRVRNKVIKWRQKWIRRYKKTPSLSPDEAKEKMHLKDDEDNKTGGAGLRAA